MHDRNETTHKPSPTTTTAHSEDLIVRGAGYDAAWSAQRRRLFGPLFTITKGYWPLSYHTKHCGGAVMNMIGAPKHVVKAPADAGTPPSRAPTHRS
jgi:hypothetical protein